MRIHHHLRVVFGYYLIIKGMKIVKSEMSLVENIKIEI
jgi:hypothetical protein